MRNSDQILADTLDGLIKKGDGPLPAEIGPLVEIGMRLWQECPDADPEFLRKLGRTLQKEWVPPARRTPWWRGGPWPAMLRVAACTAAAAALFLVLGTRAPGLQATAKAGLSGVITLFRQTGIVQTPIQAATPFPTATTGASSTDLAAAQAQAAFTIRVPSYLPEGLAFDSVVVSQAGPQPRVLLRYSGILGSDLERESVMIQEFLTDRPPEEQPLVLQIGPSSAERIEVAGRTGLWIRGQWAATGGRWVAQGAQGMLPVQDGDLLIQVWGTISREQGVHIAESMFR